MSKPELKRFIELTKAKSSEVNNNFDLLNNYVESVSVSSLTGYDPTTTYPKGAWIIGGIDNKKTIYESLVDDNKGNALDDERYWKKITLGGGGLPVGTIFPSTAALDFVPENSLPCDGMEYTKTQFPNLYTDWLVGKKLATCTYEQYQQEINVTGECLKFGIDTVQGKFKVPTKLNKYVSANQGKAPVVGNGIALGLTDGAKNYGLSSLNSYASATTNLNCNENALDKNVGTNINNNTRSMPLDIAYGVTTDGSKSGIEADLSNAIKTKEIRYFVVVATGSIKQSEMDWSQWASSLEGKANTDLSNIEEKALLSKNLIDYSTYVDISAEMQRLNNKNEAYTIPFDCEMSYQVNSNDLFTCSLKYPVEAYVPETFIYWNGQSGEVYQNKQRFLKGDKFFVRYEKTQPNGTWVVLRPYKENKNV